MKKYLLQIIAVVLAVGFSAFTTPRPVPKNSMQPEWFHFYGDPNSVYDVTEPSYYYPIEWPECTSNFGRVCDIKISAQSFAEPRVPDLGGSGVIDRKDRDD